ncbi:MAG: arginase family protein [Alphaproteobacteria bacterium]
MTDLSKYDDAWFEKAENSVNNWYWHGVPTLFRCPYDNDPANCDIGLVGVPHSSGNGSTERDQHLAPRAMRHVSGFYQRAHNEFGIVPWDVCRINDMGDVPLPEAMVNDVCVEHMEAFFKRLDRAGTYPVSIGGDHAITGPILKAIAGENGNLSGGRKAALVHFDSHTDAYEQMPHWLGSKRSAAHWAAYLVRECHVDATRSVQIGIRGNTKTLDYREASDDLGYRIVSMKEYHTIGVERTIDLIRERVGDSPVYITFDMDAFDPSIAPAAANIQPDGTGFFMEETLAILDGLRGLEVIGGDVVCIVPTKDNPNNITSLNGMVIMHEQISLIADRLKG